jgi:hypothetical protein
MSPSSRSNCPLAPGRITSPSSPGNTPEQQGNKLPSPLSWQGAPKKCCRNLKLRYKTLRQFSRKQRFIVPAQTQQICVQRLSLKNKGVSPYTPLKAGCRSKMQSSTHIWLHVTLLAISFPQCSVTFFMFSSLSFISAMPSLPPASLSEHKLVCFFSGPSPCYTITNWRCVWGRGHSEIEMAT